MSRNMQDSSRSPSRGSAGERFLRDLVGAQELVACLDATAPETCARHGGAAAFLARVGGAPTPIGFWRLDFAATPAGVALWEEMAGEHQARDRGNIGERQPPTEKR